MKLKHVRTQKQMSISNPVLFMAQSRETADEAWAGDILGIPNHGTLRIGDTLTEGEDLQVVGIPVFAPELLSTVRADDPMKSKQLKDALDQFAEEGSARVFKTVIGGTHVVGVVGALQFEVLQNRISVEYGIPTRFESASYAAARWVGGEKAEVERFVNAMKGNMAEDHNGSPVYLSRSNWDLSKVERDWPNIQLLKSIDAVV
jgi:peptide chain release factor 3